MLGLCLHLATSDPIAALQYSGTVFVVLTLLINAVGFAQYGISVHGVEDYGVTAVVSGPEYVLCYTPKIRTTCMNYAAINQKFVCG